MESVAGDSRPAVVIQKDGLPDQPRFSPDGRWIAFDAFDSGTVAGTFQYQVFVSAFPPRGDPQRITSRGGVQPMWRADGRELFYLDHVGNLMAVDVNTAASSLTVGSPRYLFNTGLRKVSPVVEDYAVSGDGLRFLIKLPVEVDAQTGFTIVLNWPGLLAGRK